jgi:pyrroline-5-carboxylate reductase
VRAKLERLGHVVDLPDEQFDEATAIMGCAPAYLALAVEALADAGAAAGLDPELARELVVETTAGTAELLRERHPADVRKAVTSPGGSTEAGLEALDREGARGAFEAAVAASLARMRG